MASNGVARGSTPHPGVTDATMSTHRPTLKQELSEYNSRLDACLRSRYGMTLARFKLVKSITQFTGAAAGIYAMSLGADPMTALTLVAFMVGGPDAIEYVLENQSTSNSNDDS